LLVGKKRKNESSSTQDGKVVLLVNRKLWCRKKEAKKGWLDNHHERIVTAGDLGNSASGKRILNLSKKAAGGTRRRETAIMKGAFWGNKGHEAWRGENEREEMGDRGR